MAYATQYRVRSQNRNFEDVVVLFLLKDSVETIVTDYKATEIKITYAGDEGKMTPIIGSSISISFRVDTDDPDPWSIFISADKNEWMVIVTVDDYPQFHGFLLHDEGKVAFQDPPFIVTMVAVDGLGLLKDAPLVHPDKTNFSGTNLIIWYIASALQQTGLFLPIRVYDNVYHTGMLNRDDDFKWDWMSQAKLEYRTFLKDATTFVDCYTALQILLTDTHRLHYWKGQWVITRLPMLQYFPYVNYYTVYDYNGANAQGFEELEDYATVGKNELIFPIERDQIKGASLAVKSTKTVFNYNVWPEIPLNNKFDRGDQIGSGIAYDEYDLDGDGNTTEELGTYKTYKIEGWTFRKNVSGFPRPTDPVTALQAYRKITYNKFDIEVLREVILPAPDASNIANANNLWSDLIPVIKGDRISFKFDYRAETSGTGTFRPVTITLISDSGSVYYANNSGTTASGPFYWRNSASSGYIPFFYDLQNVNDYTSYSIDPGEIPASGKVYLGLSAQAIGANARFKNIDVTYTPYVSGGYVAVKGDSWTQEQSKDFPDTTETEVFLSDNEHVVFKGAILDMAGKPFTPEWYRLGNSESLQYKQITNLGRFNLEYRRFWSIEGSFKGIKYAASNNQVVQRPVSLHKQYRFVNIPGEDRRFIINAPLEIDLLASRIRANFSEVSLYNPVVQNKIESVDHLIQRIRDAIDTETEAAWTTGGSAPAHGTAGFPPTTFVGGFWLSGSERSFGVLMDAAHDMTATAVNIGASHIPTVTKYYDITFTGSDGFNYRIALFQIGAELRLGDIFTFTAYGHSVAVATVNVPFTQISDGLQFGDVKNEFKYIF